MQAPGLRLGDPHVDEFSQQFFAAGEERHLVHGSPPLQKPLTLRRRRIRQNPKGQPHQRLVDRERDGVLYRIDAGQAGETHLLGQRSGHVRRGEHQNGYAETGEKSEARFAYAL